MEYNAKQRPNRDRPRFSWMAKVNLLGKNGGHGWGSGGLYRYVKVISTNGFMSLSMPTNPLKIAIVGAGFSGTILAANLQRHADKPISITLYEKKKIFGLGEAYSTPFPFHLLNVRVHDMSAFVDHPNHFLDWLKQHPEHLDKKAPLTDQFVPRMVYGAYLQSILQNCVEATKGAMTLKADEVISMNDNRITTASGHTEQFDKIVLALGNGQTQSFPFSITHTHTIDHPWDFLAPTHIPKLDPVLIVGTGLSMIDIVLTLKNQNHQGTIYAISRHGLKPLRHTNLNHRVSFAKNQLPTTLSALVKMLRTLGREHATNNEDWRAIINGLREHTPLLWQQLSLKDRRQFLRHILPYWNIHRHRVHDEIDEVLLQLQAEKKFVPLAGRVQSVRENVATIRLRENQQTIAINVSWVVNCLGPSFQATLQQPLMMSLLQQGLIKIDPLKLGLAVTPEGALINQEDQISKTLFTLGPPAKSAFWESVAVPDIRKQCDSLARFLLTL